MRYALAIALAASWTANAHGEEGEPGTLGAPGRTVVVRRQAPGKTPATQLECSAWMDAASLRDLVRQEARKQGVDEKAALAILNQESTDGEQVNSPKGARGPMQLMPATAAEYGVRDICNPVENIRGGVAFLKDLMAQFQGNMMLVAAAYNAGSERVYKSKGVPPNAETVRYVASVTNKYYGLGELTVRRGKSAPRREADGSPLTEASRAPTSKPEPSKSQQWIGGSVLYVSSDEEGDGR
jgi:hypothetical protein